ncbi:MAG: hypothetical protein JW997_04055 [Actinobacteria bacterium]|nr:hypothetical protein [Actinomycetota bacterium]
MDNMPYGIIILDNKTIIKKINESAAQLFYLDKNSIPGQKTIIVFNNKNLEELIFSALDESYYKKKEILFHGEEDLTIEVDAIPLNIKKYSLLLILRNVTQEADFSRLRSQFVANISHEMRTPLTSVKGYLETIIGNDITDNEILKKYLGKTLHEVERLYILIEDLLNLSKIEHKRNLLIRQKHDLVKIIEDCINSLDFLARKNNVTINFKHDAAIIDMQTDADLFSQLVRNMIENSIFHGGENIDINIDLQKTNKKIELIFTDNGAGIAKKDMPYIFQRFYRGSTRRLSQSTGSGLGLSIVKHITELHKGSVEVYSTPGIKTWFKFIFPKYHGE